MKSFVQLFFGFCCLLFLLFAFWQWNDPDPEIWVSVYGFAAFMCALAAFNRFYLPILFFSVLVSFLGGFYFFPDSVTIWIQQEWQQADLSMKTIAMEEARESFGLFIIFFVMSLAAYTGWRKEYGVKDKNKKSNRDSSKWAKQ